MTQEYTITVQNLRDRKSKQVTVKGRDAMLVHKEAYMNLKSDEEISEIADSENNVVFDLQKGFKRV